MDDSIDLKDTNQQVINVAIGVIHYKDNYLLGFRDSAQHQGDLYEFIGGKIEEYEAPKQGLIREIAEESGMDLSHNTAIKMGRIHHNYGDKKIDLHVYKVELTALQYQRYKILDTGLEGQVLAWVSLAALLNNDYPLPAANKTILTWLSLPALITITYPLSHFKTNTTPDSDWLNYHERRITRHSWTYCRLKLPSTEDKSKADNISADIISKLISNRPDIATIVPFNSNNNAQGLSLAKGSQCSIVAYHVSHNELITWFTNYQIPVYNQDNGSIGNLLDDERLADPANSCLLRRDFDHNTPTKYSNIPLIISCHDAASILAANQLASLRLSSALSPVLAIFLSPVLPTQTHPKAEILGWKNWSVLARLADMPVVALGGLSPDMLSESKLHGASSIAGISHFLT